MVVRIFWLGLFAPAGIKFLMYISDRWFDYPISLSNFPERGAFIYHIIDIQSLIIAVLIFTLLFYYPLRMIVNPHYARAFWRRSIQPIFSLRKRVFTVSWLLALSFILNFLTLFG